MAFKTQEMNAFGQDPIIGMIEATPSPNTLSARINPSSSATWIQVGDAVKLVAGGGNNGPIIVDKCSGPTDGPVLGYIAYNQRKNEYAAGDMIEVAAELDVLTLLSGGTITRGDKVTTTASTSTADPTVATVTVPSTQYIGGKALDSASSGGYVRVQVMPSFNGTV